MQPGVIEVPSQTLPGEKIRLFDAPGIARAVAEATAAIPPGATTGVVIYADPVDKTAKAAYLRRIGGEWSLMVYAGYNGKQHRPEAGAVLAKFW